MRDFSLNLTPTPLTPDVFTVSRRGKAFWEPSQIRQALGTDANIPSEARIITPTIERVPGFWGRKDGRLVGL